MSALHSGLSAHLQSGVTTTCRCWALVRRDGMIMGFTDHDQDLFFEDMLFAASTGLSALALQQTTGLSVDNTEALGALSDEAIREDDIEAGRFDGAEVRAWLVNWQDTEQRMLQFRGTIGEMRRLSGAFEAELRGLSDRLNQPFGRVYQKPCAAVLGDASCRFALEAPDYTLSITAETVEERRVFSFVNIAGFTEDWFRHGTLHVLDGAGFGLSGVIKRDLAEDGRRIIELWHPLRAQIESGDALSLVAGCDKRDQTCRIKFNNFVNFQGFPDIPGDDWTITDPTRAGRLDGGSRRR